MFSVLFDNVRVDAFIGLFCGRDCFGWIDRPILFVMLRSARCPPT